MTGRKPEPIGINRYLDYEKIGDVIKILQNEQSSGIATGFTDIRFDVDTEYDSPRVRLVGDRPMTEAEREIHDETVARQRKWREERDRAEYEKLRVQFEKPDKA